MHTDWMASNREHPLYYLPKPNANKNVMQTQFKQFI